MKKYLLGVVAVVMAIVFSAFSVQKDENRESNLQVYTWHMYNTAGTAELSPVVSFTGTEPNTRTEFGCSTGGPVICARAYDSEGTPLDIYIDKPAP